MNPLEKVKAALKKNPRAAAAVGFGGLFLWFKRKGGNSGGDTVAVPVAGGLPPVEPTDGGALTPDAGGSGGDPLDGPIPDNPVPISDEPGTPPTLAPEVPDNKPEVSNGNDGPVEASPIVDPAPARGFTSEQGIEIAGRSFPKATKRTMVGGAKNAYGSYSIWLVTYKDRSERWWHYNKDEKGKAMNKWTGPHNSTTGNSGGPARPQDHPAGKPTAQPRKPTPKVTPKSVPRPAAPQAPAPRPAPVASGPVGAMAPPVAPAGWGAPAAPQAAPCPPSHPLRSARGCYREVRIKGHMWHYYNNGMKIQVS